MHIERRWPLHTIYRPRFPNTNIVGLGFGLIPSCMNTNTTDGPRRRCDASQLVVRVFG